MRFRVQLFRQGEQPDEASADPVTVDLPALRRQLQALDGPAPTLEQVKALGTRLADILLPARARDIYRAAYSALGDTERLRLRMRFETFALADLPWEYIYLEPSDTPAGQGGLDGFLALDTKVSLVRYEVLQLPPATLDPVDTSDIRVVALMASPKAPGVLPLDLKAEAGYLTSALGKQGVRLDIEQDATLSSLETALTPPVHVFHFSGHGQFSGQQDDDLSTDGVGFILLEGEQGKPARAFDADRLALNLNGRDVRLAVLSACEAGRRDDVNAWTGVVPALVKKAAVPAVVGMQYTIEDANAGVFSKRFYRLLVGGESVDYAVTMGRQSIVSRRSTEFRDWGVPVLYLRADHGVLFPPRPVVGKSWKDVTARSRDQADRFLRPLQGDREHPGRFIPEVYVHRTTMERSMAAFLESGEQATVVVGESGTGKTNLLAQWATDLRAGGNSAFFYDCGGSLGPDIAEEIARDLAIGDANEVPAALAAVAQQAVAAKKQFVMVFDALGEFRAPEGGGPAKLLAAVDGIIRRLPDRGVKVVLSCSAATWAQLAQAGAADLAWSRYFAPAGERALLLGPFAPAELEEAWGKYQAYFDLRTPYAAIPPSARARLASPLLVRLLAEAHRGGSLPPGATTGASLFQSYYQAVATRDRDRAFLQALAGAMLARRRSAIAVRDLSAVPGPLQQEIQSTDPASSYQVLLDRGVLAEAFDRAAGDDMLAIGLGGFAAYVLAQELLGKEPGATADQAAKLVKDLQEFPIGWDVARMLLALSKSYAGVATLARSSQALLRELAAQSLRDLFADDPATATDFIKRLLQEETPEPRQAGLKAVTYLGAGALDILRWVAVSTSDTLRREATYLVYVRWRADNQAINGMLSDLAGKVSLLSPFTLTSLISFLGDTTITIYINHCDRQDVAQATSDLWYTVLRRRLHFNLVNQPGLDRIIPIVGRVFSQRIMEAALGADFQPPDRFFSMPAEAKDTFRRVIPLVDPSSDLQPRQADLLSLLGSDVLLPNIVAALVLGIHACADFASNRKFVEALFESADVAGRWWIVRAFTVLSAEAEVAKAWLPILERFTRGLIEEHPESFYDGTGPLGPLDLSLLPLGLAGSKAGRRMALIEELLGSAAAGAANDPRPLTRCLAAFGPLGFYDPDAFFHTVRAALPSLNDPAVQQALVAPLAIIRVVNFDAVDGFLAEIGAGEDVRRDIDVASDIGVVRRYIYFLGIYNNAVHQALHYPKMRRQLLVGGLQALVDAKGPGDFNSAYTRVVLAMLRQARYRLIEWTKPD